MWCVRLRRSVTASASQSAVPLLPGTCSRSDGSARFTPVQANLRYPASVEAAARDSDVVINLVGILFERGRQRFDTVHAFGAETVALAAAAFGSRMVHVSAIGADDQATSRYARSKATAEKLVLAAAPSAVILRPSVLFGPEDEFFNKFAAIARLSPALPLIGGGHTLFQPVFAGDVASAILAAIESRAAAGTIFELGGPEVKSFKQLMQFMLATIERRRLLVSVPFALARFQASLLQFMPNAAVDARSGRVAARRQCRVGISPKRRAHARSARHRSRLDRRRRSLLSVAVPQGRAIHGPDSIIGRCRTHDGHVIGFPPGFRK